MASAFKDLLQSGRPVLVDFTASWCGPCKLMAPVLQELKGMTGDRLTIIKVDIDKNPDVARSYSVQGVPTLILIRSGKINWRQSGVVPAANLYQSILPYL